MRKLFLSYLTLADSMVPNPFQQLGRSFTQHISRVASKEGLLAGKREKGDYTQALLSRGLQSNSKQRLLRDQKSKTSGMMQRLGAWAPEPNRPWFKSCLGHVQSWSWANNSTALCTEETLVLILSRAAVRITRVCKLQNSAWHTVSAPQTQRQNSALVKNSGVVRTDCPFPDSAPYQLHNLGDIDLNFLTLKISSSIKWE